MQNPFEGFQQGLMTGAQLGGRMRQNQQRRELGGLMTSGDFGGAAKAAYGYGDIQTGAALTTVDQQNQARQRGTQIAGALAKSDYDGAMTFASSPAELEAITDFRKNATEEQRAAAVRSATDIASIIEAVQSAPPEQQLALAQQYAPRFGVDPSKITPDVLQQLPALRIQAMGLKDFLAFEQREDAAKRPIIGPNGYMSFPPGTPMPGGTSAIPLDRLDGDDWEPVRPNQPSSARPAAGGGERSQPVSVSFKSSNEAQAAIEAAAPGVRTTSGRRSAANNRRVGGAPGSFHLQDRARDLIPPSGMSMAQLAATMRAKGFRALDEGDHVHVSW